MKRFNVTIEETISQSFEIEAESVEEAEKKAQEQYNENQISLDNPTLTCKQLFVESKEDFDEDCSECWKTFD
jgi:parvulin-like peptidyl-prolyl isomerase